MHEPFTAQEQHLIETARQFAQTHIRPNAATWERERRFPKDLHKLAAQQGLTLGLLPPEHGGSGISYLAVGRIAEELAAGCLSFALPLVAHNYVAWSIAFKGTPEQRARYLPPMLKGELMGNFSLTEPGAGSDAAAISTVARKTDKGWALTGRKAWCTLGSEADFFIVYAQTEPGSGARGISLFLVDGAAPGLEREPAYDLIGGHALRLSGLSFTDTPVPAENLLVGPGEGLKFALYAIDYARAYVASMVCGMLRSGLEEALDYVAARPAFGRHVADFQGVQWMLADVATNLEAARLLADHAIATLQRDDGTGTVAAAHAKKFATRVALEGLSACMQVMGANGMKAEHSVGRHFACAKMAQFLDGTTEIQNVVISRAMLKPYGIRA